MFKSEPVFKIVLHNHIVKNVKSIFIVFLPSLFQVGNELIYIAVIFFQFRFLYLVVKNQHIFVANFIFFDPNTFLPQIFVTQHVLLGLRFVGPKTILDSKIFEPNVFDQKFLNHFFLYYFFL